MADVNQVVDNTLDSLNKSTYLATGSRFQPER